MMRSYEIALWALTLVVAAWLLLVWHIRVWERRLRVVLEYASLERIATPDGSRIELRRLPCPASTSGGAPVLLVHGVGANHRNNDLTEELSLARHLRRQGRDVWLLTLRSGLRPKSLAETRRVRFASMVQHDLPMAVTAVLERTGAKQLDYVGFSMGGMLLYAALDHTIDSSQLRRVAIIGSPAIVRPPVPLPVPSVVAKLPAFGYPTLRFRLAARIGAFASEWVRTPAHHWVFNPANVRAGVVRTSLMNIIEDVPGPLNSDFASWAATGGAVTLNGQPVLERLRALETPVVFFAGSVDRLAPPDSVRAAFDAWGAERPRVDKQFVLLGRAHGTREEYGHGDLAVGAHVEAELFAPLARFVNVGLPVNVAELRETA